MKTMRTRLNQIFLATFLVVMLVAGSGHAEGTEMSAVSSLENVTENRLEFEEWMLNATLWMHHRNTFSMEYELEEGLGLENWMVDKSRWQLPVSAFMEDAADQELQIENWMTDTKYWN